MLLFYIPFHSKCHALVILEASKGLRVLFLCRSTGTNCQPTPCEESKSGVNEERGAIPVPCGPNAEGPEMGGWGRDGPIKVSPVLMKEGGLSLIRQLHGMEHRHRVTDGANVDQAKTG